MWRQFPPYFLLSVWPGINTPSSCICTHLGRQISSLSATLLWSHPESSCPSLSTSGVSGPSEDDVAQGVLEKTLGKKTLQIQKNSRRSWPRDGTCVLRYSLVFSSSDYKILLRFPDSLHSFLLLSIQQRLLEHRICTRHFQTWHLRRSNGNHCNHVMKTCLPHVITGKYLTPSSKEDKR